jgi:hypothetical protein
MRKLTSDNKIGLILCNRLVIKPLSTREREFVSSIMRQILDKPAKFKLSEKQAAWLGDIWERKQ